MEEIRPNHTALYGPPTHKSELGGLLGTDRVVTTCRLPLQTVRKGDIQQHLTNLDTTSTLVIDTLVSRAEPPPSGWMDIILEQNYKYWSSCLSSKANILTITSTGR